MAIAGEPAHDSLSFGPFNLNVRQRLLTKADIPVDLGARALDILIVLTASPNEIITKQDLISRVWPHVIVEEVSLRFQMTSLRKALGDGQAGARYITTIAGRGYCFVAQVNPGEARRAEIRSASSFQHANLPGRLDRMVGRDDDIETLSAQLMATRFLTIVGAGGIGKTTVAVAVGHQLSTMFTGSTLFVDLGMLGDPDLVTTALASLLGLSVGAGDAISSIKAFLRDKRILLILDTCEHVLDAVAGVAASLIEAASEVYILATSREALRVKGERVYRLDALGYPPESVAVTASVIQEYPATRLFVERAVASDLHLDITDADAPVIANVCRKLDGMPLAIELAARHVESYGLHQTALLLDQHLSLRWPGARNAPPRQKTLQATLDWSYELLSDLERTVLRRLAIFVGNFTLDAVADIVASSDLDRQSVFGAIDSLVAKSMIVVRPVGAMLRYRLLDTTRAYALEIPIEATEHANLAIRHVTYYGRWLEQIAPDWSALATTTERAPYFDALGNVRAALEWCFDDAGDLNAGVVLAAASGPAFLAMSLLPEARRWSGSAIKVLDGTVRGSSHEMHLQAVFGVSSTLLQGKSEAALQALNRGLEIAESLDDAINQVGLLGMIRTFYFRSGDFRTAFLYAQRCRTVSERIDDVAASAQARSLLGRSLHLMGDLAAARVELEASLQLWSTARRATIYLSHELHYPSEVTLARNLWLQGYPAQAEQRAEKIIETAGQIDRPAALAVVLGWAASVFLWTGNWQKAGKHIEAIVYHAETNSLGPFIAAGRARMGELAILRGSAQSGVEDLRAGLQTIHAVGYETLTTELSLSLVHGLRLIGQFDEGMDLVDQTISKVEVNGDDLYMPELLRIRGAVLLEMSARDDEAESCFTRALDLSRQQGAKGWELRAAIDLARLMALRGQPSAAHDILHPVFDSFVEGSRTADLRQAKRLLAGLAS